MKIRHSLKSRVLPFLIALTMLAVRSPAGANELAELGEALFFDTSLSLNRTQACASCHNPATAFTDSRDNGTRGAVSLGDDGKSLGDRNAPTITYAALIPPFGVDDTGAYAGGTFYDGRAASLVEQAAEPFTNPLEMNLPDSIAVVGRVKENASHVEKLKALFGETVFDDPDTAFRAIVESIVAFESTAQFAPFDSKYDRFLRGDYELTIQEELGRKLFYSRIFNCHECHLIDDRELQSRAAFSTHRYFNIGVPVNRDVRAKNGLGTGYVDRGLLDNPAVEDPAQAGKFRVPSLRNVAVTGPYMHNGVFDELETVVLFYNKFILTNPESQANPETGLPWGDPEVPETVDLQLLRQGQPVSELQVSALVSFLEALTDQRYEHLLDEN